MLSVDAKSDHLQMHTGELAKTVSALSISESKKKSKIKPETRFQNEA